MLNKTKAFLSSTLRHELISGTFFVFVGTSISNFLAFLLNIYFARNLSYENYGILAALLSFFALAVVPAAAITAIVNKFSTRFISLHQEEKAGAMYRKIIFGLSVGSVMAVLLSFFLSGFISGFLKINDNTLILFLIVIVCANYFLTLNLSFLNSLLRFRYISFSYIVSGVIKIIAGVGLVALGYGVFGALGAVLALILVQFVITLVPLKALIAKGKVKLELPWEDIFKFAAPTTVATIALFSFVSSDVILVKHFFSAKDAGLYGALSLVGKVIFYFTLPVPLVMFPLLVRRHTLNQSYKRLFHMALILVTVPSILITAFYFLFPDFTIQIFLGGRDYLHIAPLLGFFGIFLTIYSINNTFLNYFLSIGKTKSAFIVLSFAVLQILGIFLFHESFGQVITVSILTSVLLLISLAVFFRKSV